MWNITHVKFKLYSLLWVRFELNSKQWVKFTLIQWAKTYSGPQAALCASLLCPTKCILLYTPTSGGVVDAYSHTFLDLGLFRRNMSLHPSDLIWMSTLDCLDWMWHIVTSKSAKQQRQQEYSWPQGQRRKKQFILVLSSHGCLIGMYRNKMFTCVGPCKALVCCVWKKTRDPVTASRLR